MSGSRPLAGVSRLAFAVGVFVACTAPENRLDGVLEIVPRGHAEVDVAADGSLRPRVVGHADPVGLCLTTAPALDTSQWRARLRFAGEEGPPMPAAPPDARMESTICFARAIPADDSGTSLELCAEVEDAFDGRRLDLGCRDLGFEADASARDSLVRRLGELLREPPTGGTAALVGALDTLAEESGAAYPLLAIRLQLVAVYHLRRDGSAASLAAAKRRLESLPEWLGRPEAAAWSAQVEQNRATLALATAEPLSVAWGHLRQADADYLRVADPNRFTVAMHRSEILGRVGAAREGVERLAAALDDCRRTPCTERLLAPARGTLAWLILLDPLATDDELLRAETILDEALAGIDPARDPLEHANQRINRAYLRVRRGLPPGSDLAAASALLSSAPAGRRLSQLRDWAALVRAEDHLAARRSEQALELCRSLAKPATTQRIRAWSQSCVGRARRQLGDLDGAAKAFDLALLFHELASPEEMSQQIAIDPGQRAEDFYRAARVALEEGDEARSWQLLERLDRLTLDDEEAARCREAEGRSDADAERRARRLELLEELASLDLPASAERREQREPVRRALLGELQEIARTLSGDCPPRDPPVSEEDLDYRALALDDEILVLRRTREGVSLVRRTALARRRLVETVRSVGRLLEAGRAEDGEWRELLAGAGEALAPAPGEEAVVSYALHGLLQGLPIGALPRAGGGWLADGVTVALRPAGAVTIPAPAGGRPVFVVDPVGNLPTGGRLATLYRELFPGARVLAGAEATRAATRKAMGEARWIHFDTHGQYDPTFPEASRLALADGFVDMVELGSWEARIEMANLSGCDTGRWPTTADSGRYGLAGLFSRRGAAWVVASRAPLADDLAADLNESLYRGLAVGLPVPEAYARALAAVRQGRPAAAWGSVLLLEGRGVGGGNSASRRLPSRQEGG